MVLLRTLQDLLYYYYLWSGTMCSSVRVYMPAALPTAHVALAQNVPPSRSCQTGTIHCDAGCLQYLNKFKMRVHMNHGNEHKSSL